MPFATQKKSPGSGWYTPRLLRKCDRIAPASVPAERDDGATPSAEICAIRMTSYRRIIDELENCNDLRDFLMHGTAPTLRKEVELKLELAPASLPALRKVPLFRNRKQAARRAIE